MAAERLDGAGLWSSWRFGNSGDSGAARCSVRNHSRVFGAKLAARYEFPEFPKGRGGGGGGGYDW